MSVSEIEDKLYQLQVKVNKLRPVSSHVVDPSARVLDALQTGEVIVARKYFQAGSDSYQPGEEVNLQDWGLARVAQLAAHGYIIPISEYQQGMAWNAAYDLLENKLTPLRNTLNSAKRQAQNCGEQLALKKAEVLQAEHEVRTANSQVEYWTKELDQALKGEDVQSILG